MYDFIILYVCIPSKYTRHMIKSYTSMKMNDNYI